VTSHPDPFHDLLVADAARRASPHLPAAGATELAQHRNFADLRFRLVNGFPRETRPVFAAMRATLEPFGYHLSPLHPAADLRQPRMLTELTLIEHGDGPGFAPLVFELERNSGRVRVFVRQFGGRAVPDFAERWVDLASPVNNAEMETILRDYVACMLRPLQNRVAA
jgi:hypothetical protein